MSVGLRPVRWDLPDDGEEFPAVPISSDFAFLTIVIRTTVSGLSGCVLPKDHRAAACGYLLVCGRMAQATKNPGARPVPLITSANAFSVHVVRKAEEVK
jgi:hypothetical protein